MRSQVSWVEVRKIGAAEEGRENGRGLWLTGSGIRLGAMAGSHICAHTAVVITQGGGCAHGNKAEHLRLKVLLWTGCFTHSPHCP